MFSYFLTNKAVADLTEIWNYTYEVWSESLADKYYNELLNACKIVGENQDFGKNYEEISAAIFGYKSGEHILFDIKKNENEIEIIRFLHIRMNLKKRIQD
jgi:toxin ParE1/3/4